MAEAKEKTRVAEVSLAVGALRGALKAVAGVTERRNTIPILSNVRLVADGKRMVVHATDLDLWASAQVDLSDPGKMETTVSARTLTAIMAEVQGGGAVLRLEGGKLKLTAGRAIYDLPVLPAEDWPKPPDREWAATFEMAGADLVSLLAAVSYAESTEETRYYLNGVFLHAKGGLLKAVATDGHRLAVKSLALPDGAQKMPDIIVPRKAVALILQLADRAVEPLTVSVCATRIRIEIDAITIDSKLIDGTFPDYTRVIPTNNESIAKVDPTLLLGAVKRVSAISTDRTRAIKFSCDRDAIVTEVTSTESGHAREDIPADYEAGALTIGFNRDYLVDILSRATGDTMTIKMADSAAPTIFIDPTRPDLVQVLMPMRV